MISNNFKTKKELAQDLGVSMRTFQRHLSNTNLNIPRGLISPKQQVEIYQALGFSVEG